MRCGEQAPALGRPAAHGARRACHGRSRAYLGLKDCVDRWVAAAAIGLAAPLMALIALAIRWESPGPALFAQERAGKNGRPFRMLKFRTMRVDSDPYGESPATGDDPRITRVGKLLREASLDELPQLLNVVSGDMSLVGPRPLYVRRLASWNARQRSRLLVKPGLTGLAQVHGRGNLTMAEKLEWDVKYVERVSLATDLHIIAKSLARVLRRADIYEVPGAPE